MPYSSSPSYPNNPPAGAAGGTTSYVNFTQGPGASYAPSPGATWSSILSAIASAFGFGGGGSSSGTTAAPTAGTGGLTTPAPTQPPPSSFAGTLSQIADRRAAETAAANAKAAAPPPAPLTKPAVLPTPTPIAEDRATRSAAVNAAPDYASALSEVKAPTDTTNLPTTRFDEAAAPPTTPPIGEGVEAAHQAIAATPKASTTTPPARISYNLDPKTAAAGGTTTTMAAEKPVVTDALAAIAAAAPGFGLDRVEVTGGGGPGGGHVSHKYGTEMDIVGYNADGSPWTTEQRLQIANVAAAQGAGRFGLYPNGSLHFGFSDVNPHAAWGPTGTSGVPVSAFAPDERAFAEWAKSGQPYSAYKGANRFEGVPGAVDPFANATTYGAGGPARGGDFERDPQGNPVPPANIPGGMKVPPGLATGAAPAYTTLTAGAPDLGINPLPPVIAAGIIGNIQQESSFDPNASYKGHTGYGQWDASRWANAQAWAKTNGLDISDPRTQTLFYSHELQSDPRTWNALQAAKTPGEAARIIDQHFERSGGAQAGKRAAYAESAFGAFGAGGAANAMATGGPMEAAPGRVDYPVAGAGFLTGPNMPAIGGGGRAPAAAAPAAILATAPPAASLRIGASGPGVRDLQTSLLAAGYNPGAIDGKFGPATRDALFKFQQATPGTGTRFGRPDAVAGPRVRAALAGANRYADLQPPGGDGGFDTRAPVSPVPPTPAADFAATLDSVAAAAGVPMPRLNLADSVPTPRPGPVAPGSQVSAPPARPPQPAAVTGGAAVVPALPPGVSPGRPVAAGQIPPSALSGGPGREPIGLPGVGGSPAAAARPPPVAALAPTARVDAGPSANAIGFTGPLTPAAPPVSFETNPAAVRANTAAAGAAAPATPSGFVPTPYRDPGILAPDARARLLQEQEAIKSRGAPAAPPAGPQAIFHQPPDRIFADMARMPAADRVEARGGIVASVMDAVAKGGPQVVASIETSPLAFRQLSAAIGPDRARELTTMLRAEAAGPALTQRFVAAAPAARVDRRVAEHVGRMLASDNPDEFAQAVRIVAANRNLSGLLRQVA